MYRNCTIDIIQLLIFAYYSIRLNDLRKVFFK